MYINLYNNDKPDYTPGLERWSYYKTIWMKYWNEFNIIYPERFQETYGNLDDEKIEEVKKLIRCGKFQNGFKRHICPECGIILIVPFTCKSRLCLSCSRKKLFGWSLNLSRIMNTSLKHNHVTFTIPGTLSRLLFQRRYQPEHMIKLASKLYRDFLLSSAGLKGREIQPGILSTLHKSGNSLNYNPHIHLIGTRELVDTKTGEVHDVTFISYNKIRHIWKKAFLNHLKKHKIITAEEFEAIDKKFSNGFHVYFKPITGNHNDILFRTSEYIAAGYFHNSQITEVNFAKKTVTFRYKKWVDRKTKEKIFATKTMDVFSFMARMLFYLPEKNRKLIRYYGIYTHQIDQKLKDIEKSMWSKAIEISFNKKPENCPDCGTLMLPDTIYSFSADSEIKKLVKTHTIIKGYFRPNVKAVKRVMPP
jgi:hypothetical protein